MLLEKNNAIFDALKKENYVTVISVQQDLKISGLYLGAQSLQICGFWRFVDFLGSNQPYDARIWYGFFQEPKTVKFDVLLYMQMRDKTITQFAF